MSNEKQFGEENNRKVVISPEDCKSALDFWTHFEIPVPAPLRDAMDNFMKEQTYERQNEVKYQICKAIIESNHEAFKDEMFKKIVDECKNVSYEMQFDRDLETTLSDAERAANEESNQ